jgi:Kef-type K+ transport system membrane component KefB
VVSIVVLAVVVGIVTTGRVEILSVVKILVLATLFLGGLLLFGERLVARIVSRLEVLEHAHAKLLVPLVLLFLFAWLANLLQLATITGAFGAGLVIGDQFFGEESDVTIESVMQPLEAVFAPLFFVVMGLQVNLGTLAEPSVLTAALVLTLAAIVGKAAAGWSAGSDCDRLTVGLGMIPRGEEALLFASIGIGLGVLTGGLFSAVVIMVMLTALLAPVGLKRALIRPRRS